MMSHSHHLSSPLAVPGRNSHNIGKYETGKEHSFQMVWIKSLKQKLPSIYCNAFFNLNLQPSLNAQCLVQCWEHSPDAFSAMSRKLG